MYHPNIIGNSSSIVESVETNILSEECPCIDESGRVSTLVAQKRKIGVRIYVYCMEFYFSGVSFGYSLSALDGSYIFHFLSLLPSWAYQKVMIVITLNHMVSCPFGLLLFFTILNWLMLVWYPPLWVGEQIKLVMPMFMITWTVP